MTINHLDFPVLLNYCTYLDVKAPGQCCGDWCMHVNDLEAASKQATAEVIQFTALAYSNSPLTGYRTTGKTFRILSETASAPSLGIQRCCSVVHCKQQTPLAATNNHRPEIAAILLRPSSLRS